MNDWNNYTCIGRLTKDAEIKYTQSGAMIVNFSIAVNEKYNDNEWCNFFDVELWGKAGNNLNKYLTKGKQIHLSGKLKQDRWQDKQSGQTKSKIKIIANNFNGIQLLGGQQKTTSQENTEKIKNEFDGQDYDDPWGPK